MARLVTSGFRVEPEYMAIPEQVCPEEAHRVPPNVADNAPFLPYQRISDITGLRQVAEAKQYISAHLHEPLQLSEIARRLYLSTAYFSRLFKARTGQTPSDYRASLHHS